MPSDGLTNVAPTYERLPDNFSCHCEIVTTCLWMNWPSISKEVIKIGRLCHYITMHYFVSCFLPYFTRHAFC